jgi:GAF domain-containing protein
MLREAFLVQTFVELADSLVDDFDVVDLTTQLADRCVEGLDVAAAGIMAASTGGELRVVASSNEAMRLLQLLEIQAEEGPCLDCYRTGTPILERQLATAHQRWPHFAPSALDDGFGSVCALPMRLRGKIIGALNLFRAEEGTLNAADLAAAQGFADVATIAILQQRAVTQAQDVTEQLRIALNSRVVIEQAKGMVAERLGSNVEQSFDRLRNHARNHNLLLSDVARRVIDGSLRASSLDPLPKRPLTT